MRNNPIRALALTGALLGLMVGASACQERALVARVAAADPTGFIGQVINHYAHYAPDALADDVDFFTPEQEAALTALAVAWESAPQTPQEYARERIAARWGLDHWDAFARLV